MSSEVEIVVVDFNTFNDIDFKHPSAFFIRNALGEVVFFRTRDREKAQEKCDDLYGKGKYRVNASKLQKQDKPLTCRGVATRRGQKK